LWAAVLLLTTLVAGAANFTASLDRDTITLGETATLSLDFEGGAPKAFPALPSPPNLQITGRGRSTSITIVNGQSSATESHTFMLAPAQPGEFTIPEMSAEIGGQVYKSQPLKLTVLKPGTAAPAAVANPQQAFLKLMVPKTEVYVGEILPLEIQLYIQSGQLAEMPHFKEEGFTLGKMLQPTQSDTIANNRRYKVVSFKSYVVAAKVGTIELGPATMAVNVPRPDSRRSFFGEPIDWQSLPLQSEPVTIQSRQLPRENVPAGFSGAVGNFSLNVNVSPTNIAVGDPIMVKVQIAGRGAIDAVTLPDQPGWQQFKLYPPTSDFQPSDQLGVTGTKSFALTAVPESMEVKELPPFSFSFFDPDQKQYRTLTQPAVALTVRPSAASLPPPVASNATATTDNAPPDARDIVHIKPRMGALAEIQSPLALRPWFVALQGVPILAWLSLLIGRKQKEKLAGNPRLRRQRQVEQTIRTGLKELQQSANTNQREAFFATLFRLLQEQLGERLDLPASAITEAVVEERLHRHRVPEETLALLRELFHACNQVRYAQQANNEELLSLVPKVESALRELKKINR
jgi:regulator of replication initiation timing